MDYLLAAMNYFFNEFTRLNSILMIFLFNLLVFAKIANWQKRVESKLKTYRYFTYTQAGLILVSFAVNLIKKTQDNLMALIVPLLIILIITAFGLFKIRQEEKIPKFPNKP
jgi:L-asparagine transporter-like permease